MWPKWRAHGVNANQCVHVAAGFERGELSEPSEALMPVTVSNPEDEKREPVAAAPFAGGSIHIELPGRALNSTVDCAEISRLDDQTNRTALATTRKLLERLIF